MLTGARTMTIWARMVSGAAAFALGGCAVPSTVPVVTGPSPDAERCQTMAALARRAAPVSELVITSASWQSAAALPAHCEVQGYFEEREGTLGQTYRIGFRMRLPQQWNGRFLFQGGGGSNGVVRDATGPNGPGNPLALERGYAVIAQDSGHDNTTNNLPDHQGELVFGFDPEARRNYGHASLPLVNDLAHHLMLTFYGRDSDIDLFWGCSKGGQEGMAFAQRYPDAFDGIVAAAPGMSLPRAAVQQTWDTQQFAKILTARGISPSVDGLRESIGTDGARLIGDAVAAACDGLDGAGDGIVSAVGLCTTERVLPQLRQRQCAGGESAGTCLEEVQIEALVAIMGGAHDSSGQELYAPFAWDPGIGATGWLAWKTGYAGGPQARNVLLGGSSLAAVFSSPPTALLQDPQTFLEWQLRYDFDRDPKRIYAVVPPYENSAWSDIAMRSADLQAFRARGGKMIVPHGVADPVFSILDTIDWWEEVDGRSGGRAGDFVRVFPVPGMAHCGGGPSTDRFNSLAAIEQWVIEGRAPDTITASAGQSTPWPGREMPLCPWPKIALAGTDGQVACARPGP